MVRMSELVLVSALVLAACSDFPELDGVISPEARAADYPALIPIDQALLAGFAGQPDSQAEIDWLIARAAALRRRARALARRPVIDNRSRRQMASALERHFENDSEMLR